MPTRDANPSSYRLRNVAVETPRPPSPVPPPSAIVEYAHRERPTTVEAAMKLLGVLERRHPGVAPALFRQLRINYGSIEAVCEVERLLAEQSLD